MHDIRWVINLGNSICGVALLVLPYCFSQCGVILGIVLLSFSAVLTTWSCHLLLENVFACKSASYEGIAKELYGRPGKLLVELSATTLNIGCCSAFFVIISDLSPGVISWITGSPSIDPNLHLIVLTSLGLTVILPLSLIRNLEPLNYVSLASLSFYITLTIQLFYWAIINGRSGVSSSVKVFELSGIFHVLPIYALGFSCHLQLMAMTREVVGEVKDGMGEELTRMKWISKGAVSIVSVLYGSVSLFGHIAFCSNGVEADVLSNFNHGQVAQVTRFGFAVSVLLSFPFMVNPCRAALYSLIYKRSDKLIPTQKHGILTFGIVSTAFLIAVITPNVAVVVALTGAISGAVICYLFPAVSYLYNSTITHSRNQKYKAYVLICVGMILLTLGTISALMSSASHEKVGEVIEPNAIGPSQASVPTEDSELVNPAGLMELLQKKPVDSGKVDEGGGVNKGNGDNERDEVDEGAGVNEGGGVEGVRSDEGNGRNKMTLPNIGQAPENAVLVGDTLSGGARTLQENKKEDKETSKEKESNVKEETKSQGEGIERQHENENKDQQITEQNIDSTNIISDTEDITKSDDGLVKRDKDVTDRPLPVTVDDKTGSEQKDKDEDNADEVQNTENPPNKQVHDDTSMGGDLLVRLSDEKQTDNKPRPSNELLKEAAEVNNNKHMLQSSPSVTPAIVSTSRRDR